jgi:hypothetical protein
MKKLIITSLLLSIVVLSCKKESEPEPRVIRAFVYLYNFLPGLEGINWTVDGVEVPEEMYYSKYLNGGVLLDSTSEEIEFFVKNAASGEILASRLLLLEEGKYYSVMFAGTLEDPVLLFYEIDTNMPVANRIKFQIFHAAVIQDSIDIYMGGTSPDKRVVTGLGFNKLTDPFDVIDADAMVNIIATLHSEEYNEENVLLSSQYNGIVVSGASYLGVVAPFTSDTSSDLTLLLIAQPLEF